MPCADRMATPKMQLDPGRRATVCLIRSQFTNGSAPGCGQRNDRPESEWLLESIESQGAPKDIAPMEGLLEASRNQI
ncbi:hypothetical protein [Methanothrix sp.]|uniref:hypothetical protein n=1 Tax=Methanothrix sp. TaxID=90426 RepID=UPI001BD5E045